MSLFMRVFMHIPAGTENVVVNIDGTEYVFGTDNARQDIEIAGIAVPPIIQTNSVDPLTAFVNSDTVFTPT